MEEKNPESFKAESVAHFFIKVGSAEEKAQEKGTETGNLERGGNETLQKVTPNFMEGGRFNHAEDDSRKGANQKMGKGNVKSSSKKTSKSISDQKNALFE